MCSVFVDLWTIQLTHGGNYIINKHKRNASASDGRTGPILIIDGAPAVFKQFDLSSRESRLAARSTRLALRFSFKRTGWDKVRCQLRVTLFQHKMRMRLTSDQLSPHHSWALVCKEVSRLPAKRHNHRSINSSYLQTLLQTRRHCPLPQITCP